MTATASPPGGMLLVTVDRLPAWLLPLAGCTWVATPTLDALAGRGLVLDRMLATSDDPLESLAGLAGRDGREPATAWPLVTAAAAAGWAPALVTDDALLAAACPAGAAVCHVPIAGPPRVASAAAESHLGRLVAAAIGQLAAGPHRLLWCHSSSLGDAWDAPDEIRNAYLDPDDPTPPAGAAVPDLEVDARTDPDLVMGLRQVFAGQVTLLDTCLGELLEAVEQRADRGPWTIVVAGVRGMPLGLHARIGCGPLPPYAELIHLPAVLVDHRGRMAAQRYGGLTMPVDLGRTLLDLLAGGPRHESLAMPTGGATDPRCGQSLVGLLENWRGPQRDRVLCRAVQGVSVTTPAWHLVRPETGAGAGTPQLYARPDDYFDTCDVSDRSTDVAESLAAIAALLEVDPARAWTMPLPDGSA